MLTKFILFLVALTTPFALQAANEKIVKSHALSLVMEPKYPEGFERFNYTSANAVKGGRLKLAGSGTFDTVNPFSAKGVPIKHSGLIYDTLMTASADEPATLYGNIASHVEYSDSHTWLTFHLNPAAKFSDGKAITAEDVQFTFELLTTQGDPSYKLYFKDVTKVEIINTHTVKFTLAQKNTDLLSAIASLVVLPKHYWQSQDFEKTTLEIPVSSGPYVIKKLEAGRFVTYARNKNYWARDLNVKRDIYNFDEIHVDYYRDIQVAFEAFKSGDYDYHYELISKNWSTGYDIPAVKDGRIQQLTLPDSRVQGMSGAMFNLRKPLLKDLALRQAITLAFDFEWTNKNIFYGLYHRTHSFFQNTSYQAQGKPSAAELELLNPFKEILPSSVFGEAYSAPRTDGSGNNRKNLRTAKKILTEAGYTVKGGKLFTPDGKTPVVIELIEHQQSLDRIINPWIANLKRLGITINLRFIDTTQWVNRIQAYDFEMTSIVFLGSDIPGNEQLVSWGSESADTPQSSNYMGIKNPAVDAAANAIINAETNEQRITAARALDRILTHNHYLVPKYHNRDHRIAYWNKFSRPEQATTYDFRHRFGIHTWWYDASKADKMNKSKP